MKTKITTTQVIVYLLVSFAFAYYSKASTYLKCSSKDLKTCTIELSKGEVIIEKVKDPKTVIVKIDYVKFDSDKGTVKVDKD